MGPAKARHLFDGGIFPFALPVSSVGFRPRGEDFHEKRGAAGVVFQGEVGRKGADAALAPDLPAFTG